VTQRIRRRRFVLTAVPTQTSGDRIYTLVNGRFVFEKRRYAPLWTVSDTRSELFFDLGEETLSNIFSAKKAVISRYLESEVKRKTASRQKKRRILSWREKVVLTRKNKIQVAC
jgi:hypothetical protein